MKEEVRDIKITRHKFPDNIRFRPGKEVGSTDNASVILREVIDNSIDEVFQKYCDKIDIRTKGDGYLVIDNGRGIPITKYDSEDITMMEVAVSRMDAGSKFNKVDTVAIGMNGHGIKCTNALSNKFVIFSRLTKDNYSKSTTQIIDYVNTKGVKSIGDDTYYFLHYSKGILQSSGVMNGIDAVELIGVELPDYTSTAVYFEPDDTIFDSVKATIDKKSLSYLNLIINKFYDKKRSVQILIDGKEFTDSVAPYKFEFNTSVLGPKGLAKFYATFECSENMRDYDTRGSINSLSVDQGKHIDYVASAYRNSLKEYFNINHDCISSGLRLLVISMAEEVEFNSQTKEKCVSVCKINHKSKELENLNKEFFKVFKANYDYFDNHVARLNAYATSLNSISVMNKIKSLIPGPAGSASSMSYVVPKCVADAYEKKDRKSCELFIVEGRSAGGTILKVRDARYQAVFHLRGNPMNAIETGIENLFKNVEMNSLLRTIGCGLNEFHDTTNARYGKLIISADADPDGGRISSSILGTISKRMKFLVEEGYVYILDTPLYKQNGIYYYADNYQELNRDKPYTRYKGLGEISSEDAARIMVGKDKHTTLITTEGLNEALSILTRTDERRRLMGLAGVLQVAV